jgi:GT2 family glycosyltransferase
MPVVSFVIPVRNDAERLRTCLETIRASAYPRDCLEIIVADNDSTDGSDRVARSAGAEVIPIEARSVAFSRNTAAAAARGDVLAFIDADHSIDAGWVRNAVDTLQRPRVGAVGSLCQAPPNGTWVQQQYDRMRSRVQRLSETEWLGSGNLAVWRNVFDQVGGFDPKLETCEDVDLCKRIRARGYRLVDDPRLKNVHFGDPDTLRRLFVGELWRGRDNLRVSLRGGLSLRDLPSFVIPAIDVVAMSAAIGGLIAASRTGLLIFSSALACMVALACLRAARILARTRRASPPDIARAFAVAFVYDLARALALVVKAPHHRKHRSPVL